MPGVKVTTAVRSGPTGAGDIKAAQFFLAGTAQRGPVDEAVLVRGMSEFKTYFGDYLADSVYPHVQTFFEEGGGRAYVYRVVGSGASAASVSLSALEIAATNPGTWGNDLSVEVIDGGAADTVKLKLSYDGTLLWTSRDVVDGEDAENVVNTSPVSYLIEAAEGLSSVPALTTFDLSGGTAGSAPVEQDYLDALEYFTYDLGCGAVALPTPAALSADYGHVWDALIEHANDNNRIALLGFAESESVSTAQTAVVEFFGTDRVAGGTYLNTGYANAEHAAFYYPWVTIPSPLVQGLYMNISPEAFVAASRAKAISRNGPWMPGAGVASESRYVADLSEVINRATVDSLDETRINALRKVGSHVRVYGARSASNDEDNWRYVTFQDVINYIVVGAEERLEDLIFSPIDVRGELFGRIEAALICLLAPIRESGGLYEAFDTEGRMVDPGYSVRVDEELNPPSNLAIGKITASVGVRVSSVGDQILVSITKSNLTTSLI